MLIELSDDEIEILCDVFNGYGCNCLSGDTNKIQVLAERLGIWKPGTPPTEEELKRREEFAKSPYGKLILDLIQRSNEHMAPMMLNMTLKVYDDNKNVFIDYGGKEWSNENVKIGSTLRIRLPNDYKVNDDNKKE